MGSTSLVEPIAEQIRQALQNERVSEEDAKKKLESVRQSFIRGLKTFRAGKQRGESSATVRPVKPPTASARPRALPFNIRLVARALDTNVDDLRKLIAQGHTVEEIANKNGISLKEIAKGLVASVEVELNEAVESGRIKEEDAKRRLDNSREAIIRSLEKFVATNENSSGQRDRTSTKPGTVVRPDRTSTRPGTVVRPDRTSTRPGTVVRPDRPATIDRAILPSISSPADILRLLEIDPDTVRKLRGEGLATAEIAHTLGLGRAVMLKRLIAIGKQRIRRALEQRTISAEEATKLIAHFEALVQKWLGEIFAAPVPSRTGISSGTAGRDIQGTRESNTSGSVRDTSGGDSGTSNSGTSTESQTTKEDTTSRKVGDRSTEKPDASEPTGKEAGTNEDKETSSLGTTSR